MKAYITRIKEVNPFINAVIGDRFLAALTEAKNCDDQLKAGKFDIETLEKEKPLYGVPISIKECLAVKGTSNFFMFILSSYHFNNCIFTFKNIYRNKKRLLKLY